MEGKWNRVVGFMYLYRKVTLDPLLYQRLRFKLYHPRKEFIFILQKLENIQGPIIRLAMQTMMAI
jgi:hypothetical protein